MIEKLPEKSNLSIERKDFPWQCNDVSLKVSKILEFRWDICPNCESFNYADEKCEDCWYWTSEEISEKKEKKQKLEEAKRLFLSQKNSWNWKKYKLKIDWNKYFYHHYKNRITDNTAKLEISTKKIRIFIEVTFSKEHKVDFNNLWEYDILNISLKEPENFDWKHKIIDSKTKKWVYFDYELALKIAKLILNDKNFFTWLFK